MNASPLAACTLLYLAKEHPGRTGSVWSAFLEPTELRAAAQELYAAGYHLEDICGLDALEGAVCVYHFDRFDAPGRVTLRVIAPHAEAEFPSIASIFQGAEWHERESADFYGFTFPGNPNPIPLLLPDDMAHVHPLRKDEAERAPLSLLLSAPERETVFKAEGFTLLDTPAPQKTADDAPRTEPPDTAAPRATPQPTGKNTKSAAAKTDAPIMVKSDSSMTVKTDAPVMLKSDSTVVVKANAPVMVKGDASVTVLPDLRSVTPANGTAGAHAVSDASRDIGEKTDTPAAETDTTPASKGGAS
jgi:NADH-quinone oxidoreductase subunit C